MDPGNDSNINTRHDGYKSRKFWATVGGVIMIEAIASSALFWGTLTPTEWTSLNQWMFPLALGIFSGANVVEKVIGNGR